MSFLVVAVPCDLDNGWAQRDDADRTNFSGLTSAPTDGDVGILDSAIASI
jgi:hypothetical protein